MMLEHHHLYHNKQVTVFGKLLLVWNLHTHRANLFICVFDIYLFKADTDRNPAPRDAQQREMNFNKSAAAGSFHSDDSLIHRGFLKLSKISERRFYEWQNGQRKPLTQPVTPTRSLTDHSVCRFFLCVCAFSACWCVWSATQTFWLAYTNLKGFS